MRAQDNAHQTCKLTYTMDTQMHVHIFKSHSLLQGIFPTQGLNPGLLCCRRILYHLSRQGSPKVHVQGTYSTSLFTRLKFQLHIATVTGRTLQEISTLKFKTRARFGSTYTKIGTIQRRLAWPLRKDDMQIREVFHIFKRKKKKNK